MSSPAHDICTMAVGETVFRYPFSVFGRTALPGSTVTPPNAPLGGVTRPRQKGVFLLMDYG